MEQRNGIFHAIRRCIPSSAITGIITAIIAAMIVWLSGTLSSLPANYATKPDLKSLEAKHNAELQRLDSTKMDKAVYDQNHSDLRSEIKDDLNDIKIDSRATRELVLKILTNQQVQYKKVNNK